MAAVFALVITLVVVFIVVKPFFYAEVPAGFAEEGEDIVSLGDRKERCVQALKDLEMEYTTSKIAEDHYTEAKQKLSVELSSILARVDQSSDA